MICAEFREVSAVQQFPQMPPHSFSGSGIQLWNGIHKERTPIQNLPRVAMRIESHAQYVNRILLPIRQATAAQKQYTHMKHPYHRIVIPSTCRVKHFVSACSCLSPSLPFFRYRPCRVCWAGSTRAHLPPSPSAPRQEHSGCSNRRPVPDRPDPWSGRRTPPPSLSDVLDCPARGRDAACSR